MLAWRASSRRRMLPRAVSEQRGVPQAPPPDTSTSSSLGGACSRASRVAFTRTSSVTTTSCRSARAGRCLLASVPSASPPSRPSGRCETVEELNGCQA
eukprot:15085901-Alexandrium_andersonii.AAC.1